MVDVSAFREAYTRMDLSAVAWVRSENNPAESLTKPKENMVMNRTIDQGKVEHDVGQWVVRSADKFRGS